MNKASTKVAIVIQARSGSQRCKNKMLRKFANSCLFEIQIKKFSDFESKYGHKVYAAVGEESFYRIIEKYNSVNLIRRDNKSISSDRINDVFNYLNKIEEDYICFVNSCTPLLLINTVNEAINAYFATNSASLTSVLNKHTWFYDHLFQPLNSNSSGNTKDLDVIYECTHNFHIFKKNYFLEHYKYWDNSNKNPYLFKVSLTEALDIDTEEEFTFVEKVYKGLNNLP